MHDDVLEDTLADLRLEYLETMPSRVGELRGGIARSDVDEAAREGIRRASHRIAGTAATVGLGDIGRIARAMERFTNESNWSDYDIGRLAGAVALIEECVAEALGEREARSIEQDARYLALFEDEP